VFKENSDGPLTGSVSNGLSNDAIYGETIFFDMFLAASKFNPDSLASLVYLFFDFADF
jgi:hypothetical protein